MQLKTLTWNIGGGKLLAEGQDPTLISSYSIDGIPEIITLLKTESPDIITIQEAHQNDSYNQIELIADQLGYAYYVHDSVSPSHIDDKMQLGNGIISRYPIMNHTTGFFCNPHVSTIWEDGSTASSFDKGYTTCTIDVLGISIAVTALHLIPFRRFAIDINSQLATKILADVSNVIKHDADKWIIQGDFNIDKPSLRGFLPTLFAGGVDEVVLSKPTTPKNRHYDHVLYRGLMYVDQNIINQVTTDHYPVVTNFHCHEVVPSANIRRQI